MTTPAAASNYQAPPKLELTFGTDPELMIFSHEEGRIINAIPFIEANKHNPVPIQGWDGKKEKILFYADNSLAEMAVPPAQTPLEGVKILRNAFSAAQDYIGLDHSLYAVSAHAFTDLPTKPDDATFKKWQDGEIEDKEIAEEWKVGCSPNWDAYTGEMRPQSSFKDNLRTGSFHIHIGNRHYKDEGQELLLTQESKLMAIKLMDIYVGCAAVRFDRDPTSRKRKELYGKAGEFRPTPYGIEYRVLGNYALRHPKMVELVYELAAYAMSVMADNDHAKYRLRIIKESEVKHAINSGAFGPANQVLSCAGIPGSLWNKMNEVTSEFYEIDGMLKAWGI